MRRINASQLNVDVILKRPFLFFTLTVKFGREFPVQDFFRAVRLGLVVRSRVIVRFESLRFEAGMGSSRTRRPRSVSCRYPVPRLVLYRLVYFLFY